MSETEEMENPPRTYSGALLAAIAVALLAAVGGLIWCFTLNTRLTTAQAELADAKQQNVSLAAEQRETDARLKVATDELGKSLGLTQKQMEARAQAIVQQEDAENKKLETAQAQTEQQVSQVSSDVTTVKSDVGGVKTDLGKTQTDLATTITQLASVRGDLSSTNSVIARNHDELVTLEHKGDRNYYEFTLLRGAKPQPVSTVSLQLKKTDGKKGKFTMNVTSDDKTIEKRDRNIAEPIQFYSGRDHLLFELVVWTVDKNKATGYLSTPKSAPVPVSTN
jgi:DNA anti-recombination protein RmuC